VTKFQQRFIAFFICAFLWASILSMGGCSQEKTIHQERLVALGTIVDISMWDVDDELAHKATDKLDRQLNEIHNRWHAWHKSELTTINEHLAAGKAVTTDAATAQLLAKAKSLSITSDSLFNPAIGQLVAAWGFQSDDTPTGPPPSPTVIAALVAKNPNMNQIKIENRVITSTNPAIQLDMGGFAKGYAVDAAISTLRELGIENAIVNAGGDLKAIGKPGNRSWRIGIRHPRSNGVIASLEVNSEESVFTSGDYERYYEFQGKRYHHIIDPRSGFPAQGTISITVIHNDAATADAAATALFIAGPEHWTKIARKMGIKFVMLVDIENQIQLTPAMAERLHFEIEPTPQLIIKTL